MPRCNRGLCSAPEQRAETTTGRTTRRCNRSHNVQLGCTFGVSGSLLLLGNDPRAWGSLWPRLLISETTGSFVFTLMLSLPPSSSDHSLVPRKHIMKRERAFLQSLVHDSGSSTPVYRACTLLMLKAPTVCLGQIASFSTALRSMQTNLNRAIVGTRDTMRDIFIE